MLPCGAECLRHMKNNRSSNESDGFATDLTLCEVFTVTWNLFITRAREPGWVMFRLESLHHCINGVESWKRGVRGTKPGK